MRQGNPITCVDPYVRLTLFLGVELIGLVSTIEPNLHVALRLPPSAVSRAVGAFFVVGERALRFDNCSDRRPPQQCGEGKH